MDQDYPTPRTLLSPSLPPVHFSAATQPLYDKMKMSCIRSTETLSPQTEDHPRPISCNNIAQEFNLTFDNCTVHTPAITSATLESFLTNRPIFDHHVALLAPQKHCPPQKYCPPQKHCPPQKLCPRDPHSPPKHWTTETEFSMDHHQKSSMNQNELQYIQNCTKPGGAAFSIAAPPSGTQSYNTSEMALTSPPSKH